MTTFAFFSFIIFDIKSAHLPVFDLALLTYKFARNLPKSAIGPIYCTHKKSTSYTQSTQFTYMSAFQTFLCDTKPLNMCVTYILYCNIEWVDFGIQTSLQVRSIRRSKSSKTIIFTIFVLSLWIFLYLNYLFKTLEKLKFTL